MSLHTLELVMCVVASIFLYVVLEQVGVFNEEFSFKEFFKKK